MTLSTYTIVKYGYRLCWSFVSLDNKLRRDSVNDIALRRLYIAALSVCSSYNLRILPVRYYLLIGLTLLFLPVYSPYKLCIQYRACHNAAQTAYFHANIAPDT